MTPALPPSTAKWRALEPEDSINSYIDIGWDKSNVKLILPHSLTDTISVAATYCEDLFKPCFLGDVLFSKSDFFKIEIFPHLPTCLWQPWRKLIKFNNIVNSDSFPKRRKIFSNGYAEIFWLSRQRPSGRNVERHFYLFYAVIPHWIPILPPWSFTSIEAPCSFNVIATLSPVRETCHHHATHEAK